MLRIPSHVLAFAGGKTELYEAFHDYFNNYCAINYKANVDYDKTINFAEKEKKMHDSMLAEIMKYAGLPFSIDTFSIETVATHPNFVWASFAVINAMIDMVLSETMINSVGIYTDVRTGGWGDSFAFEVKPRDLFVVTKSAAGKRTSEMQHQFNGQVTLVPVEHDVTVDVSLYNVLAGKQNLAEFVMKAIRSIETEVSYDAYTAFNTAMTNLPTTPTDGELKLTSWDQADAIRLASAVTAFNMGAVANWVGTKTALANIMPADANYRYTLDSDYVKIGYIRNFMGYDAIELPQVADWKNPFKVLLDDTRIYVVSPSAMKLIKLCFEGSTLTITSDIYAKANLKQTTTLKKRWIAGVCTNSVAGLVDL